LAGATVGRELDRVGEEVPHDLPQASLVTGDRCHRIVEYGFDLDGLRIGRRAHGLDRRLDRRREIDRLDLEAELARDDARYVQDVPYDPLERPRILLDHLERARRGRLVQLAPAQQAGPEENRTERRPELIAERRQELRLDAG